MQKSQLCPEGAPAIHYGEIHTHYGVWAERTKSFIPENLATKLRRARQGDLIIATTSEDDASVAKATAWLGADEVAVSGDAYIFRHTLAPRYMAYFFQCSSFQDQKSRRITGSKVRRLSGDSLARVVLPVPPLEIQQEIVRVLDRFTQLEARKRQYAHYREQLLIGESASDWVPLRELGQFIRGRRFTKRDMVSSGTPCIHYGEIYTHYGVSAVKALSHVRDDIAGQLRYAQPGDVVIAGVGETVSDVGKSVAWLGDDPVAIHDDTFCFRSEQDPSYISYVIQTDAFQEQKNRHVARAKVKRIGSDGLGRIMIPVPPLEEQRRIASILDKFDALVNDLNSGLPAEIAARRKQYEYYRDRLLTFEEKR